MILWYLILLPFQCTALSDPRFCYLVDKNHYSNWLNYWLSRSPGETWLGLCHAKIIVGIFCPHGRGCRSSPKSSTQSPTEAVKHGSRRRGSAGTVCTIWAQPRLRQSTKTTYSPLPYGSRDVANQTCPKYLSTRSFKDEWCTGSNNHLRSIDLFRSMIN